MPRVTVPIIATASVRRSVAVDVPEHVPKDQVERYALEQAQKDVRENEDLANEGGTWSINLVDPDSMLLDENRSVAVQTAEDAHGAFERPGEDELRSMTPL